MIGGAWHTFLAAIATALRWLSRGEANAAELLADAADRLDPSPRATGEGVVSRARPPN